MGKIYIYTFFILLLNSCINWPDNVSSSNRPVIISDFEKEMHISIPESIKIIKLDLNVCEFTFDETTEKIIITNIHKSEKFDPIKDFTTNYNIYSGDFLKGVLTKSINGYFFLEFIKDSHPLTSYGADIDTIKNIGKLEIEKGD